MTGEPTTYRCHSCGATFPVRGDRDYGTYEFTRCPECDSAKTTLANRAEKGRDGSSA